MEFYKYVPVERIDILKNNLIRFTQPSALNDPGEMRVRIKKMISNDFLNQALNEGLEKGLKPENMAINLQRIFKEEFKLDFTIDDCKRLYKYLLDQKSEYFYSLISESMSYLIKIIYAVEPSLIEKFPTILNEQFGLLSLSEIPFDMKMWSHYAMSHTGFVIVFDGYHNFFNIQNQKGTNARGLHKVEYTDNIPTSELMIKDLTWEKLFFTKGKDWEHEKEWRMVKVLKEANKIVDDNDEKIYLFEIPFKAIKGVILGYRMSEEDREDLFRICENDSRYSLIKIQEAKLNEREYKIDIIDL